MASPATKRPRGCEAADAKNGESVAVANEALAPHAGVTLGYCDRAYELFHFSAGATTFPLACRSAHGPYSQIMSLHMYVYCGDSKLINST